MKPNIEGNKIRQNKNDKRSVNKLKLNYKQRYDIDDIDIF